MKLPNPLPPSVSVVFSTAPEEAREIVKALCPVKRFPDLEFENVTGCAVDTEAQYVLFISYAGENWKAESEGWEPLFESDPEGFAQFVSDFIASAIFTCPDVEPAGGCDFSESGQAESEGEALAPESRQTAENFCRDFLTQCASAGIPFPIPFYGSRPSRHVYAGHELHMSTNGHGCGFWEEMDSGESLENPATLAGKLEKIAQSMKAPGELYRGDDGKLYFENAR